MATAIERLYRLTVDANQATRELKKVNKRFDGMTRTAKRLGGALASVFAAQFSVQQVRSAIEFGDALAKTADKVGLTVESLQAFRFAAEQSGVAANTLDMAMQRFGRRLGEAAKGTGVLAPVIKELGIDLKNADGTLRSSEAVLRDYADAIKNAATPQEQLRLAFKAFDSEGAALVNMLRNGSEGMQELADRARDAGVVMDEGTARQAEVLQSRIGILSTQIKTKLTTAAIEAAAAIAAMFGVYTEETQIRERMNEVTDSLGQATKRLEELRDAGAIGRPMAAAVNRVAALETELADLVEQMNFVKTGGEALTGTVDDMSGSIDELGNVVVRVRRKMGPFDKAFYDLREKALNLRDPLRQMRKELLEIDASGLDEELKKILRADVVERYRRDPPKIKLEVLPELEFDPTPMQELGEDIKDAIEGMNTYFADTLITSLKEGENAFKAFGTSIIETLTRIVLSKAFEGFFSSFGNWAGNLFSGGAATPTPTPGQTRLMATPMLATAGPGQQMNVGVLTAPTYGFGAIGTRRSGINVTVNNNAPVDVEVQQHQTAQGIDIDLVIEQKVAQSMSRGGLDRVMRSNFGAQRRGF